MKRYIILFIAVFMVRFMSSCFITEGCSDNTIYYDYKKIRLSNINNSDIAPMQCSCDSMYGKAIAFEVELEGEPNYLALEQTIGSSTGFSTAVASECVTYFEAINPVKDIKITTLFDISDSINVGFDVTNDFLYSTEIGYISELYIDFNEVKNRLKNQHNLTQQFYMFFTDSVQNDSVSFVVEIILSNDSVLIDTLNTIYILH